ncbi:hypothetical protein Tco_0184728, partial [Tanacetum coccineum]
GKGRSGGQVMWSGGQVEWSGGQGIAKMTIRARKVALKGSRKGGASWRRVLASSSTKLSLSSGRSSFIGMMRDSSDRHFFKLEMWKVLWTLLSSLGSSSLYATGLTLSRILNGLILKALSDLYYLFDGFMDYLWSRELDISNFDPADRIILPVGARATGAAPRIKSIWNSTWRTGGRLGRSSGKTFGNSLTTVPGLMTHLVASLTLDSARSCVMQGSFLTQGKASSIPTIFSWGNSISPDGFLPYILLLLVIIDAVAIVVTVILVVVVVGEGCSIIKLSFMIIGSLHRIVLCYLIH